MASPVQASDAWIRARDRYVEDLTEEKQQRYFKASPESLLDDARAAEQSHSEKSTTRSVMEKLQPFVTAIEQYGEAIDVYSSTYSLALGPIWGSIKVLLHIAREFGKYFDKLVDMFARIGDVLPRFRTYERLFPNHEHLIQALSVAYFDIIGFCSDAKSVFRRGQRLSKTTAKMTLKLLWKSFDAQFGQRLSAFREHKKNVEKEAGLANMIEAADARAMMLVDQKQLEKRRREDNRLRIVAMLNAVDYEAKHRKLQNLRHAGTGEWLVREAVYVEWKTPGNSALLCCHGIPGCGKSILASNLVDNLVDVGVAPAAPASDIIYYYCDYADQRTLHLDRILGSLLKQMYLNHQIPEHFESKLLQIYAGGTRSPAENALCDVFCSSVAWRSNVYIVFDGIDECENTVWQEMLKIFKHLATLGPCNIKIVLTCVEEGPVAHKLHNAPCVQLSPAATAEDVKTFVVSSVRSKVECGDLRIRNAELEKDIISELVLRANGMFLWVFFQLQDLCDSSSDAMIRETLRNLPEGLGDTYRRILIKISKSPSRATLAQKVFHWATVAKRPLHIEELKEAVAFAPNDKSWNVDKIPREDFLFESCRGLIIKDEDDETAHFAHHTVQQYLTGGLSTVDPQFKISIGNAEVLAGQICVAYLSFSDFETQITSAAPIFRPEQKGVLESGGPLWIPNILGIRRPMFDIPYRLVRGNPAGRPVDFDYWKHLRPTPKARLTPSRDLKDKYQLLGYAIEFWEPHTRWYLKPDPPDSRYYLQLEYLAMYKTLAFEFHPWGPNQHFGPYGCIGCPSPDAESLVAKDLPHMSMIHYAAEKGNLALLVSGPTTSLKISGYLYHERYHQETLLIACRHNRLEIVKYLRERGDYDVSDGRAVNATATAGHAELLQYLLSLGQYSVKQQGDVALRLAAQNGNVGIITLLAEAGADLNAKDQRTGRNAIEWAAMYGHESALRYMLEHGAWEYYVSNVDTTAIHLAAANGQVAATRALLESGFPTGMTNSSGRTALHDAAESGHKDVAEVLLEHGADPTARAAQSKASGDQYDKTPFHLAAKGGHVKILELFGTLLPAWNYSLTSLKEDALHLAAAGGHDKAIRWLVGYGAYVNATDASGETPLCHAIKLGDVTTVRVLLELGAIVIDEWSGSFSTETLALAVGGGTTAILELLLTNIQGSQRAPHSTKRQVIFEALISARNVRNIAAMELLEQELKLYPEAKGDDNL